jgi:hypothetical protein
LLGAGFMPVVNSKLKFLKIKRLKDFSKIGVIQGLISYIWDLNGEKCKICQSQDT